MSDYLNNVLPFIEEVDLRFEVDVIGEGVVQNVNRCEFRVHLDLRV